MAWQDYLRYALLFDVVYPTIKNEDIGAAVGEAIADPTSANIRACVAEYEKIGTEPPIELMQYLSERNREQYPSDRYSYSGMSGSTIAILLGIVLLGAVLLSRRR